MSSKLVKFKGLDVDKFVSFVDNIDINKLPFAIEIRPDKITCKVHPTSKTFVKYFALPTNDIFEEIGMTEEINYLRFNMINVKKLKEGLSVYKRGDVKTIDGEFDVIYDEGNEKSWRINHIRFKSKHVNLKVSGHEPHKVPFLPDNIWKEKLYDVSKYMLKFEINTAFVKSTLRLIDFEKDVADKATSIHKSTLQYLAKDKLLSFKSKDDKWKIDYNLDGTSEYGVFDFQSQSDLLFAIQEIAFRLLNAPVYTVYLVNNINMGKPMNLIFFVNNDDDVIMSSVATVNK